MAITDTKNEVTNGTRKTRAKASLAASSGSAYAGRDGRGDPRGRKTPRVTSRSTPNRKSASRSRRVHDDPVVELTIDLDDDRVIDAMASFLLGLVDHGVETKT